MKTGVVLLSNPKPGVSGRVLNILELPCHHLLCNFRSLYAGQNDKKIKFKNKERSVLFLV